MPGPTPWQQTITVINSTSQTITLTTETVVATLTQVFSRSPGAPVNLNGYVLLAAGAGTTSCFIRVRQDSLTGTAVTGNPVPTVTASTTVVLPIEVQDIPAGEYAGKTYVLTVQPQGATANSTVTLAVLTAQI